MRDYRLYIEEYGGPDVLKIEEIDLPPPGAGEVRVRHDAIGLNFVDTYNRSGLYPVQLPSGLGGEAAGTVEAVGAGVHVFKPGDRVAYGTAPLGGYSSARLIGEDYLVPLPDGISGEIAAAATLKGMTVESIVERCAKVRPGQTVLVHAAAGGVGSILVQWLKALGARVLAHVGSEAKMETVRALGIGDVCAVPMDALAAWVRDKTGERGADVVFDGVGAASWQASIASIARRGLVVSYGNASGPVPPFSVLELLRAGSAFVTRPSLYDYCADAEELRASAARVYAMIESGAIRVTISQRFGLREAADAHRALMARRTQGSTILLP